jgi:sporulation protein YlmC with PRC-barrel domain
MRAVSRVCRLGRVCLQIPVDRYAGVTVIALCLSSCNRLRGKINITKEGPVKSSGVIYVSRLMNCKVKSPEGETIGKLEELVIDAELGRAAYGVIKSSGRLLKSGKIFAVPCGALQLSEDESGLVLDVEKESLQNAPAFNKSRWPDMSDRRWGNSIHAFFETTPYWEDSRAGAPRRHGTEERPRGDQQQNDTPVIA